LFVKSDHFWLNVIWGDILKRLLYFWNKNFNAVMPKGLKYIIPIYPFSQPLVIHC